MVSTTPMRVRHQAPTGTRTPATAAGATMSGTADEVGPYLPSNPKAVRAMAEPYTPSVEEVLSWLPCTHRDLARRMIAQVRREAAAEALRDAARDWWNRADTTNRFGPRSWLNDRAAAPQTGEPE
jgi:hypothetical protein